MIAKIARTVLAAAMALGMSSAYAQDPIHLGTVVDTMNAGGYTYVQMKEGDETFWLAGPAAKVAKGDTVEVSEQVWMNKFHSNSLNRTFDRIMFVGNIVKQ